MNNAVKQPQTIVVLGGSSDIGQAIVAELASPVLRHVVLAVRDPAKLQAHLPRFGEADVSVVEFDAAAVETHEAFVSSLAERFGELDVVIQAFGQLGTGAGDDPAAAAELAMVNYVGAVSSGLAVASRLREQGHGTLIVISSVAGVRTRPSNFVYGSTKAGQDGFATGLGHALHGTGARVMTVRPGFVRTSMTEGLTEAPFSVDAADVAAAVAVGLRRRKSVVWAPGVLRYVFAAMRLVPDPIWRRLDR